MLFSFKLGTFSQKYLTPLLKSPFPTGTIVHRSPCIRLSIPLLASKRFNMAQTASLDVDGLRDFTFYVFVVFYRCDIFWGYLA